MWQQLGDVVRDVESRSAAELVVEVRARAGSYAHADARFGATLALFSLVVLVFMPLVVPPLTVLLDAPAFYLLGVLISRYCDPLRRVFTTKKERAELVHMRAAALFHERRVGETERETGVLFFASMLERRIEVIADRGVLRAVQANEWNALLADFHDIRVHNASEVAAALRRVGALLERDLPAGDVNADELPNAPEVVLT